MYMLEACKENRPELKKLNMVSGCHIYGIILYNIYSIYLQWVIKSGQLFTIK